MARPHSDKAEILYEQWMEELGLCKGFRLAASLVLLPESYNAVLHYKRLIKRLGATQAFRGAFEALLYTGPRPHIDDTLNNKSSLLITNRKNHSKAVYLADHYGYSLLERTPVGQAIEDYQRETIAGKTTKISLYTALEKTAAKHASGAKNIKEIAQRQFDIVMGFVSAAFIFCCEGNVDTLVSGANPTKVFYLFELPALMANPKITSINGVPKTKFLETYDSGKTDATYQTYRMICTTEIDRLGILAHSKGKKSQEWKIWKEQKELFYADSKQRDVINVHKSIESFGKGKQRELITVFKNILAQKETIPPPPANSNGSAAPLKGCKLA